MACVPGALHSGGVGVFSVMNKATLLPKSLIRVCSSLRQNPEEKDVSNSEKKPPSAQGKQISHFCLFVCSPQPWNICVRSKVGFSLEGHPSRPLLVPSQPGNPPVGLGSTEILPLLLHHFFLHTSIPHALLPRLIQNLLWIQHSHKGINSWYRV